MIGLCFILQCQMALPDLLLSAMHGGSCPSTCDLCLYFHRLHILHPSYALCFYFHRLHILHPSYASGCTCDASLDSFLRGHAQAAAPAGAPVAAKTKEEAVAKSKNVSAQQQPAAPQADRMPAPPRKAPAPVDPKEVERRREAGREKVLFLHSTTLVLIRLSGLQKGLRTVKFVCRR